MHVIKQTFKIVLNHKYGIFALLFIQAHTFEEKLKKNITSRCFFPDVSWNGRNISNVGCMVHLSMLR
jgi:hypothetical protein